jgi:hypothetical protein
MENCNVNCPGYVWDGVTKPDSEKSKPMPTINIEPKQSEPTGPTIQETRIFLLNVKTGYKPTKQEEKSHSKNMKTLVAQKYGIDEKNVDKFLKQKRMLRESFGIGKTKRNAPCPCGSGVQHRKCCGLLSR